MNTLHTTKKVKSPYKTVAKIALVILIVATCFIALSSCESRATQISAEYMGGKIYVGDSVSSNDVRVVAHYADAIKRVENFSLQYDFSVAGEREITVTYVEDNTTLSTTIKVTVLKKEALSAQKMSVSCNISKIELNGVISKSNLAVTVTTSQGTPKLVDDYILTYDFSSVGDKQVTVTYVENGVELTETFTVTVIDTPARLLQIVAKYNGESIMKGENVDKSKIAVTAYYDKADAKAVTYFTISYDSSKAGDMEVVVSYTENSVIKTTTVTVTVEAYPSLAKIEVTYSGGTIYTDANVDRSKLAVTAFFDKGETKSVTNYTLNYDSSVSGEMEVTVSYTENNVTKSAKITITVIAPDLADITATYVGDQIKVGENINPEDFEVVASYSNNTSKKITNFNIGGFSSQVLGAQLVEISYTENGITKTASLYVTVVNDDVISNENISIHFLELGNANTGDCVYVKAGNTDILIDAGSRENSAPTILNYLKDYVQDGVLEYVIATHAHQDHITGFYSSSGGIFDRYQCETIIDFPKTNNSLTTSSGNDTVYGKYVKKRDEQVKKGANHYTALDCVNNANGANKVYNLTVDGSITMEILYQEFYEKKTSNENNYSVCLMITQGENHYLFTGDLEDDGEKSLVDNNPTLPRMTLYKGGHHGSYTAASEELMEKIQPQYVCICCCAGNVEYLTTGTQNLSHSFPAQEFIDRVAPYTDNVYVTTRGPIKWDESKNKWVNDGFVSMNGNITFSCINGEISVVGSNNSLKLKETEWFKENRICPDAWKDPETT